MLLLMTVNPGFGGQRYIPAATEKIARARRLLDDAGSVARLQVDGGISHETIGTAFAAGADTFVAGSAIFKADNPGLAVKSLRDACGGNVS